MSESVKPTSCTEYFLGVDGGGTGTEACVMDAGSTVLGRGRGGPSNINYVPESTVAASIEAAVSAALSESGFTLSDIKGACLALAGAGGDNPQKIRLAVSPVLDACPFIILEDTYSALAAAHEGRDGIVVIAGTGSNCIGMRDGKCASAGGYGALLGDEGSAYAIALRGLRRVMQAYDGREGPTVLTDLFLKGTGLKTPRDFIVLTLNLDRTGIAALSRYVFGAADELHDADAIRILNEEAEGLVKMVAAVASTLGLHSPAVAARGGCFNSSTYRAALETQLLKSLPSAKFSVSSRPASEGAAILARNHFLKGKGLR